MVFRWEGDWVLFTAGVDPWPTQTRLICADKAARRSSWLLDFLHKQQSVSALCWCNLVFLASLYKCDHSLVPYMEKQPESTARKCSLSSSSSCRIKLIYNTPSMRRGLCMLSRTINQGSLLGLKWNNTQILSPTTLFSRSLWTMCRHRIPVSLELAWQLWLETENVTAHPQRKEVFVGGNGIFMTLKMSQRNERQAAHNEITVGSMLTKKDAKFNKGSKFCHLRSHREEFPGDSRLTPFMYPSKITWRPQMFRICLKLYRNTPKCPWNREQVTDKSGLRKRTQCVKTCAKLEVSPWLSNMVNVQCYLSRPGLLGFAPCLWLWVFCASDNQTW